MLAAKANERRYRTLWPTRADGQVSTARRTLCNGPRPCCGEAYAHGPTSTRGIERRRDGLDHHDHGVRAEDAGYAEAFDVDVVHWASEASRSFRKSSRDDSANSGRPTTFLPVLAFHIRFWVMALATSGCKQTINFERVAARASGASTSASSALTALVGRSGSAILLQQLHQERGR